MFLKGRRIRECACLKHERKHISLVLSHLKDICGERSFFFFQLITDIFIHKNHHLKGVKWYKKDGEELLVKIKILSSVVLFNLHF